MYGHSEATNHQDYINELDEPRKSEIQKIHDFIRKTVPKLEPFMQGGTKGNMMAYGRLHYKTKSGIEGEWCKIALANNKQYISIYVCATIDRKYIAETHQDLLYVNSKPNVGKSCIRYKSINDINWEGLAKVLKLSETTNEFGS